MFKRFFNRTRPDNLSKIDYWKKWEFFELFDDLHKAEQLLDSESISNNDAETFKAKFIEELYQVEGDNIADFTRIWEWFSPNKDWDKVVGTKGSELGKRIFKRADRWKRNQEFIPWTKVTLKNEFGVVLDKEVEDDLIGLIRWDTEKENDVEDWRGLFGTFLQAGGKVVGQDHDFKFIDEKGALKRASR